MEGTNESASYFLGKYVCQRKRKKEGKCIFEISLVIPPIMKLVSNRLWEKEVCLFWCSSFFTILYQTIWYSFLRFVSKEALGVLSVCMYVHKSVCIYVCMNECTSVYMYIYVYIILYVCIFMYDSQQSENWLNFRFLSQVKQFLFMVFNFYLLPQIVVEDILKIAWKVVVGDFYLERG